jgi:hypothetical protein
LSSGIGVDVSVVVVTSGLGVDDDDPTRGATDDDVDDETTVVATVVVATVVVATVVVVTGKRLATMLAWLVPTVVRVNVLKSLSASAMCEYCPWFNRLRESPSSDHRSCKSTVSLYVLVPVVVIDPDMTVEYGKPVPGTPSL